MNYPMLKVLADYYKEDPEAFGSPTDKRPADRAEEFVTFLSGMAATLPGDEEWKLGQLLSDLLNEMGYEEFQVLGELISR